MFLTEYGAGGASSYGLFVLETLIALAVIALAGWAVVRFSGQRLSMGGKGRRMRLIERLVLEPRRSIHLVEVDGETLLIGTSERAVELLDKRPKRAVDEAVERTGVEE
jgi:flagellar biosynthetic protein FliO